MAIIPRGGFRNKNSLDNTKLTIPDDGRAKPYKALATLGNDFAKVAARTWKSSEDSRKRADLNQALEDHAIRNQKLSEGSTDLMAARTDGRVSEDTTFSENMANGADDITSNIAGELADNDTRTAFLNTVASKNVKIKVSSLQAESKYVAAKYVDVNNNRALTESSTAALTKTGFVNEGVNSARNFIEETSSDVAISKVNAATKESVDRQYKATMGKSLLNRAIIDGDITSFTRLTGTDVFESKEAQELMRMLERNEGVSPKEYLAAREELAPETDPTLLAIRDSITPVQKLAGLRSLLLSMRDKKSGNRAEFRQSQVDLVGEAKRVNGGLSAEVINARLSSHIDKGILLKVPPNALAALTSEVMLAGQMSQWNEQTAMLSNASKKELLKSMPDRIKDDVAAYLKDRPYFSKAIAEGVIGEMSIIAEKRVGKIINRQELEKRADIASYIVKYSPSIRAEYSKVMSNLGSKSNSGKGELLVQKVVEQAKRLGTADRDIKVMSKEVRVALSDEMNSMFKTGDLGGLANRIIQLKNTFGAAFTNVMNDLSEDKVFKDTASSLAVVHWMKKNSMRRSLGDLQALELNKDNYDRMNIEKGNKGGKKFNFDAALSKLQSKKIGYYISNTGNNSNLSAKQRYDQVRQLIEARFYTLKSGKEPSSKDRELLERAEKQVIGDMHLEVSYKNSKIIVPKNYGVTSTRARAGVKVLRRKAKAAVTKVPIKTYEKFYGKFPDKMDEAVKRKAIQDRISDNIIIYSPAGDNALGGDGIQAGVQTDKGIVPLKTLTNGEEASTLRIPYSDMRIDKDIEEQEDQDASEFFDFEFMER